MTQRQRARERLAASDGSRPATRPESDKRRRAAACSRDLSSVSSDPCTRYPSSLIAARSPDTCRRRGRVVLWLRTYASPLAATARYPAQYLAQAPEEVPGDWTGRQATALELLGPVEADEDAVTAAGSSLGYRPASGM